MKTLFTLLSLTFSLSVLAQAYVVTPSRWGNNIVSFPGASGDLFATHEFQNSRGPGWKAAAITFVEEETDAVEISGKIEDGTISEHCMANWESIDMVEIEGLSYKWKALKPLRSPRAQTILYTVATYGEYVIKLKNGRKLECPYLINEYVFLNKPSAQLPFTFLGQTED